ncbi:MAG: Ig domain-containing protein [Nitrospira sp.]|nr:Ig domain-containing protein [Nitrospira sp.]
MMFSQNKIILSLFVILVGVGSYTDVAAMNFEMELVASIPNPSNPQETLSTKVILGAKDRATDGFDTAWDVVAIPGGMIQVYLDHSEYNQDVQSLWRDTRSSTGFPKVWNIRLRSAQSGNTVTLKWTLPDLSNLPSNVQIQLVDITDGHQRLDMRTASSYNYLHSDHAQDHFFQMILDEVILTPPPSPSTEPSASEPPPQVQPTELQIGTHLLPAGILQKNYQVQLESKGGTPPYRWQIVSGKLPQGLKLDANKGVISGKPRRLGQYRLTLKLIDANGVTVRKAFTLSIVRKQLPSRR